MLEFGDSKIKSEESGDEIKYEKCPRNLNDLVFVFKHILEKQYNMAGYINITEDQGQWGSGDPNLPIILKAADFVTLL